ncbi:hypothetical protein V8E55_008691 [Tylopilus felleus]
MSVVESDRRLEWLFPVLDTMTRKVDLFVLSKLFEDPRNEGFNSPSMRVNVGWPWMRQLPLPGRASLQAACTDKRLLARLTKEVVRRGCPYRERTSASRLRRVASFRSCVAPSWLYRWKRRLERIFKEVDRRGCSWGQRSSASRASTRPGPALPQVAGTGRRARGRLHKEMNRSGCPFGRRESASWFEDSCLAKIRHSSQPVVTSDD